MFASFSPGGTRKRSSLTGLISMPKHPLCPAVPQSIVLSFGINNIYFSKSNHSLSLNLFLSVRLSVVVFFSIFSVLGRPPPFPLCFTFDSMLSSSRCFLFPFIQVLLSTSLENKERITSLIFFCLSYLVFCFFSPLRFSVIHN